MEPILVKEASDSKSESEIMEDLDKMADYTKIAATESTP